MNETVMQETLENSLKKPSEEAINKYRLTLFANTTVEKLHANIPFSCFIRVLYNV